MLLVPQARTAHQPHVTSKNRKIVAVMREYGPHGDAGPVENEAIPGAESAAAGVHIWLKDFHSLVTS
jgi:hypothetical protein